MRLISFFILIIFSTFSYATCQHAKWDETAIVKKVNDGDTVTLDDGRRVRFIGINTPEINYKNLRKSAPYAIEAKALIERYVRKGDKVKLVFDRSKHDKYGRMLAYVYSRTGRNLALMQLQKGFAKHWVVGKNDAFWKCFQIAERQARKRKKGVWSNFKPLKASQFKKSDAGYQYVSGVITTINKTSKGLFFVLDKKIAVKVSKSNLLKFKRNNIHFRLRQRVLLNGKISLSRGKGKLILYHPAQFLHN